ncbi:type II toxin-antitoxin system death-on-curing family toxin [Pseudomonas sp. RW3S2]|uniref:type II toxin-antitoxin system death-on-curing family toxin n=1 Tax=Pseudomonas sp. RW3S2 TaxID=485884 RepID=UPI0016450708|nr:type II toxin-antitoxin system death-on-curing family toxin [Pseudomonas sp. RW3S2]MBC3419286.1 type II toxin-antitoxin system death-on-curing family toxin [Pseudomonas sp. RW3S2]
MPTDCDGIHFLLVEDLIAINRWLIETQTPDEPIGVIKPNELDSAQQKPGMYRWYEQTEDLIILVSVLIAGIADNHCFANANKRTAAAAGMMFFLLNGYRIEAPPEHLVDIIVSYVVKTATLEDLQNWLAYYLVEFDTRILDSGEYFSALQAQFPAASLLYKTTAQQD